MTMSQDVVISFFAGTNTQTVSLQETLTTKP